MKYYTEVGGRTVELEIEERTNDLIVSIGGRKVRAELKRVGRTALFSLLLDEQSHEVFVDQSNGDYVVMLGGERYPVKVQDERARRLAAIAPKAMTHEGEVVIRAPMPGMVVSLEVAPGDAVKKGHGLLVLEAMKMENELRSPRDGTVKAVHVARGERVEHGRTLVVIG